MRPMFSTRMSRRHRAGRHGERELRLLEPAIQSPLKLLIQVYGGVIAQIVNHQTARNRSREFGAVKNVTVSLPKGLHRTGDAPRWPEQADCSRG